MYQLGLGVLEIEPRAHTFFFSLFILIYFDVQGLLVYLSGDKVSLYSPGYPRTCYAGIPMHSYRVLELWPSALTPNLTFYFEAESGETAQAGFELVLQPRWDLNL